MRQILINGWAVLATLFSVGMASAQGIPAFSGADGPGANATGGRGGDVYHVTRLDFDKDGVLPGSFKYGINTAPANGRTIVFDVGGTIFQNGGGSNWWFRSGASNITIAGQTAPGGITIAGVGSKFTGNNIVVRNLTVRPNQDPVNPTNFTYDGLSTQATNSIIDHVSVTWASDEGISATDAVNNTTVQYSLIGEGLNYNGHSYGSIINSQNNNAPIGYHHNLYAHNNSRNPRLGSEIPIGYTAETFDGPTTNFYNNVIYNWVSRAGYSALNTDNDQPEPSRNNIVSNFYLRGANNGSTIFQSAESHTEIYQSGNLFDSNKDGDFSDGVAVTWSNFSGTETQLAAPLSVAGNLIDSATEARDRVVAYGGAIWWDRNPIDARIIESVVTGTGVIINTVPTTEWNDVVTAPMTVRAADWDSDLDGMPKDWELLHGLDPNVAENNGDFDSDGYTNLEEYINEIAEWPAPAPIVFNAATNGRYAQITNWDVNSDAVAVNNWQPSRFDTAVIDNGAVAVDAVGQHAGNVLLGTGAGNNVTLNITAGWLLVQDEEHGLSDGAVVIGDNNAATAALNLSGGQLVTKTLLKGDGGSFNFTGGTLSAETVGFDLANNGGTLAPGASVVGVSLGMTHVLGDLSLESGVLEIEVGGTDPGEADVLIVDGGATLGGTLRVVPIDLGGGLYVPQLGDQVPIVASQFGTSGTFDNFDLPTLGIGRAWTFIPGATTSYLEVIAVDPLFGDYNGDGSVDAADYTVWRDAMEHGTPLLNEAASPGVADEADYLVWKDHFGNLAGIGATAAVPEPTTFVTIASLAPLLAVVLRSRRHLLGA